MISIDLKGTLTISLNYVTIKTKAQIFDSDGTLIYSSAITSLDTKVDYEFPNGTYKLNIIEDNVQMVSTEFSVKVGG